MTAKVCYCLPKACTLGHVPLPTPLATDWWSIQINWEKYPAINAKRKRIKYHLKSTLIVKQSVVIISMKFYAYVIGYTIVNCQYKMYCQNILSYKNMLFE